jgi:glutathione reductase (NADPH)
MNHYDLIAIGGGSGGLSAAERAAMYGKKAAVVEAARLGGTCVNAGCVPKKVMWNAAFVAHTLEDACGYGFDVAIKGFDWSALVKGREEYIGAINEWYHTYLKDSNIDEIVGKARFLDARTIEVGTERYTADHIVVSPGGSALVPALPGSELGITSDGFFALAKQPKRVAVVGGGYIAVELAGLLNALGSEVDLLLRRQHFLAQFDAMLRDALMEEMVNAGVNILPNMSVEKVERRGDGKLNIHCAGGHELRGFDALIWAVGRTPNTADLNLEAAGVAVDDAGCIPTDEFQNTNVPGIYAVGDVTGRAQLTPVAIAAARRLCDRLFNNQPERKLEYHTIPTVIFSHPPIASVGLSEEQARDEHGEESVKVYTTRFTPMYHALTEHKSRTAMKLVCVGAQEKIVGCHIIGRGADEMLQGFAVAIKRHQDGGHQARLRQHRGPASHQRGRTGDDAVMRLLRRPQQQEKMESIFYASSVPHRCRVERHEIVLKVDASSEMR